jgi:hypothetical protein
MVAQCPYRPATEREQSAWFALWPEKRQELQLAWVELLPFARATERRHQRNANQRNSP